MISILPGESHLELDAGPQHANPMGTLHGRVLCDLADLAMGAAYASTLGSEETFTTLELKTCIPKITQLRGVKICFLTG